MKNGEAQLKAWNDDCVNQLTTAEKKMDDVIIPDLEQFQKNTHEDISQQFGDFLYACLGERVTGQRSSVLNTTFFNETEEGKNLMEEAKKAGKSIEDYLVEYTKTIKQHQHNFYYRRSARTLATQQVQLYITTGRRFGISYFTGDDGRTHTMYLGKGECLKYLTQEHVDCVKNRQKRECVQDFFNFKTEFFDKLNDLRNCLIPLDQIVELGMVSILRKANKLATGIYNNNRNKEYLFMDETVNSKITHMMITVQDLEPWNKKEKVSIYDVRNDTSNTPAYISIMFLNIDDHEATINIVANLDMSVTEVMHSLRNASAVNQNYIVKHLNCTRTRGDEDVNVIRSIMNKDSAYNRTITYEIRLSDGNILNMDVLWNNPVVQAEVKKRIAFYNDMSNKLQELKHKFSTLYFLHSDL